MGSLLFMPGYCEKIDIWHLKRKDTMIQVKKEKKKKKTFTTPSLGSELCRGIGVPNKENGLFNQQGKVWI